MTSDPAALYATAAAGFAATVATIGDRWSAPTALPGWDVRALVDHIIEEQQWVPTMLRGVPLPEPAGPAETAAAALAEITADGALDRPVELKIGEPTGREYVMQIAADHLVHTWDLAVALGGDDRLDAGAVAAVTDWFADREDGYRAQGAIGPRIGGGGSAQDRLLGMFGRSPALAAVTRFQTAFDAQDVDAVMAAMTDDCVFEDTAPPDGTRHVGAAAVRAAWTALFATSPPAAFRTEDIAVAGDRVVARWRYDWDGGHVRGIDLFTVRDGRVAEKCAYVKG